MQGPYARVDLLDILLHFKTIYLGRGFHSFAGFFYNLTYFQTLLYQPCFERNIRYFLSGIDILILHEQFILPVKQRLQTYQFIFKSNELLFGQT